MNKRLLKSILHNTASRDLYGANRNKIKMVHQRVPALRQISADYVSRISYHCQNRGFSSMEKQTTEPSVPIDNTTVGRPKTATRALLAFATYKKVFKSCDIPVSFVVPKFDPVWPSGLWGMKLGSVLSTMRSRNVHPSIHKELMDMGYDLKLQNIKNDFNTIYEALQIYKQQNGHLNISRSFVVPHGEASYPENMWGMPLGVIVRDIRFKGCHSKHRSQLEALGLDYSERKDAFFRPGFEAIYRALEAYKSIHGNVDVPQKFIISEEDDRFPDETVGIALGQTVHKIRVKGYYSDHREQLEKLGFNFETRDYSKQSNLAFDTLYSALTVFRDIRGDVLVPTDYIVPYDDPRYPTETHGIPLGAIVQSIRHRRQYREYRPQLEEIGFCYNYIYLYNPGWRRVKMALLTYKELYGNFKIPRRYRVEEGDTRYHRDTWGVRLGFVVNFICNNGQYAEKREELIDMGFTFESN